MVHAICGLLKVLELLKCAMNMPMASPQKQNLLAYKVPANATEYFPLQFGNAWTYRWQNDYRDEAAIEKCQIIENDDKPPRFESDTTPPKVERTIPDLSGKIATDLNEIRIAFNERMTGIDVAFTGVPVGDIRWEDNSTTLVISFKRRLASSKIYRLILGQRWEH